MAQNQDLGLELSKIAELDLKNEKLSNITSKLQMQNKMLVQMLTEYETQLTNLKEN